MTKQTLIKRCFCLLLGGFFWASNSLFAYATETNFWTNRKQTLQFASTPLSSPLPRPSSFSYPTAFTTLHSIKKSPSKKIIYHIQDIHQNHEAQLNISHAIKQLVSHKSIDLVALEGAFNSLDLDTFKTFPHPEIFTHVTEGFLKNHHISGPIHAALTSQESFPPVVGIDDEQAYKSNVQAYRKSTTQSIDMQPVIDQLNAKKKDVFNVELLAFDRKVQDYNKGDLSMGAFLGALNAETPHMVRFLSALKLEENLDLARANDERTQLLTSLLHKLDKENTKALLQKSIAYRLGNIRHTDFYAELKSLASTHNLSLNNYPELRKYITYTLETDAINSDILFAEIKAAQEKIYAQLIQTKEEQALVDEGKHLALKEKLVQFALTPEEWNEYKKTVPSFPGTFEKFYEEAEKRDVAMVENLLLAMKEKGATRAILVTGGFHSNGIEKLLAKEDVTLVSLSPKTSKLDQDNYLSIFAQEKSSLEQLFEGEKLFLAQAPLSFYHRVRLALASIHASLISLKPIAPLKRWFNNAITGLSLVSAKLTGTSTNAQLQADNSKTIINTTVRPGQDSWMVTLVEHPRLTTLLYAVVGSIVSNTAANPSWINVAGIALSSFIFYSLLRLIRTATRKPPRVYPPLIATGTNALLSSSFFSTDASDPVIANEIFTTTSLPNDESKPEEKLDTGDSIIPETVWKRIREMNTSYFNKYVKISLVNLVRELEELANDDAFDLFPQRHFEAFVNDRDHGLRHALDMVELSMMVAIQQSRLKATRNMHFQTVFLAAFFHDISVTAEVEPAMEDHAEESAFLAGNILEQLKYEETFQGDPALEENHEAVIIKKVQEAIEYQNTLSQDIPAGEGQENPPIEYQIISETEQRREERIRKFVEAERRVTPFGISISEDERNALPSITEDGRKYIESFRNGDVISRSTSEQLVNILSDIAKDTVEQKHATEFSIKVLLFSGKFFITFSDNRDLEKDTPFDFQSIDETLKRHPDWERFPEAGNNTAGFSLTLVVPAVDSPTEEQLDYSFDPFEGRNYTLKNNGNTISYRTNVSKNNGSNIISISRKGSGILRLFPKYSEIAQFTFDPKKMKVAENLFYPGTDLKINSHSEDILENGLYKLIMDDFLRGDVTPSAILLKGFFHGLTSFIEEKDQRVHQPFRDMNFETKIKSDKNQVLYIQHEKPDLEPGPDRFSTPPTGFETGLDILKGAILFILTLPHELKHIALSILAFALHKLRIINDNLNPRGMEVSFENLNDLQFRIIASVPLIEFAAAYTFLTLLVETISTAGFSLFHWELYVFTYYLIYSIAEIVHFYKHKRNLSRKEKDRKDTQSDIYDMLNGKKTQKTPPKQSRDQVAAEAMTLFGQGQTSTFRSPLYPTLISFRDLLLYLVHFFSVPFQITRLVKRILDEGEEDRKEIKVVLSNLQVLIKNDQTFKQARRDSEYYFDTLGLQHLNAKHFVLRTYFIYQYIRIERVTLSQDDQQKLDLTLTDPKGNQPRDEIERAKLAFLRQKLLKTFSNRQSHRTPRLFPKLSFKATPPSPQEVTPQMQTVVDEGQATLIIGTPHPKGPVSQGKNRASGKQTTINGTSTRNNVEAAKRHNTNGQGYDDLFAFSPTSDFEPNGLPEFKPSRFNRADSNQNQEIPNLLNNEFNPVVQPQQQGRPSNGKSNPTRNEKQPERKTNNNDLGQNAAAREPSLDGASVRPRAHVQQPSEIGRSASAARSAPINIGGDSQATLATLINTQTTANRQAQQGNTLPTTRVVHGKEQVQTPGQVAVKPLLNSSIGNPVTTTQPLDSSLIPLLVLSLLSRTDHAQETLTTASASNITQLLNQKKFFTSYINLTLTPTTSPIHTSAPVPLVALSQQIVNNNLVVQFALLFVTPNQTQAKLQFFGFTLPPLAFNFSSFIETLTLNQLLSHLKIFTTPSPSVSLLTSNVLTQLVQNTLTPTSHFRSTNSDQRHVSLNANRSLVTQGETQTAFGRFLVWVATLNSLNLSSLSSMVIAPLQALQVVLSKVLGQQQVPSVVNRVSDRSRSAVSISNPALSNQEPKTPRRPIHPFLSNTDTETLSDYVAENKQSQPELNDERIALLLAAALLERTLNPALPRIFMEDPAASDETSNISEPVSANESDQRKPQSSKEGLQVRQPVPEQEKSNAEDRGTINLQTAEADQAPTSPVPSKEITANDQKSGKNYLYEEEDVTKAGKRGIVVSPLSRGEPGPTVTKETLVTSSQAKLAEKKSKASSNVQPLSSAAKKLRTSYADIRQAFANINGTIVLWVGGVAAAAAGLALGWPFALAAIAVAGVIGLASKLAVRSLQNEISNKNGNGSAQELRTLATNLITVGELLTSQDQATIDAVSVDVLEGVLPNVVLKRVGQKTSVERLPNLTISERALLASHLFQQLSAQYDEGYLTEDQVQKIAGWLTQFGGLFVRVKQILGYKRPMLLLGGLSEKADLEMLERAIDQMPKRKAHRVMYVGMKNGNNKVFQNRIVNLGVKAGVRIVIKSSPDIGTLIEQRGNALYLILRNVEDLLEKTFMNETDLLSNLVILLPKGEIPLHIDSTGLGSSQLINKVSWAVITLSMGLIVERFDMRSIQLLETILSYA